MMEYAKEVIQDAFYEDIMTNLIIMEDPDRYYNWYHGYTEIEYSYYYMDQFKSCLRLRRNVTDNA